LFTALDYLQGHLISSIERQHRHQEWLEFLKKINRETPKHLQLHLIVDNYATHKHPKVKAWLEKRQFQFGSRTGKLNHHVPGTAKCAADSLRLERQGGRYFEQNTASP
jgi:hypothetical protein